ncbi:hypothetical protein [Prosthecobacter sp.]|uniref:hypothetical protein n=1 Tax=Prosthecobacter sp. TaxID=1965333 RepID=UPI003783F539
MNLDDKTIKLTRAFLVKKAAKRPLGKLRWQDLRGPMRAYDRADVVIICEGGKAKIMKDRQGDYLKVKRDVNGCVDVADLKM